VPLSFRRGRVTGIVDEADGLVRLEVDGAPCISYPRATGPVENGDEVVVNVQARRLRLGSGGFDVVVVNLTRGLELEPDERAHVMTLPYTSCQRAVRHAEEDDSLAETLAGMPVVCCSLHSQLAPVCAGIGADVRVAYLQLAGGALDVALSDSLRVLKAAGLVDAAVAASPCVDGDVQCVNVHSALAWAAGRGFDAAVCAIGPGIVGTGSRLGHGGLAAADAANAASALGGSPVLAVRASEADPRPRHQGVSHHTEAALGLCLGPVTAAWPAGADAPGWLKPREEIDVTGWDRACAGLPLEHMGRGPDEDPAFFAWAYAAGRLARELVMS
jgi:Protein of unknown function (DUF3866)